MASADAISVPAGPHSTRVTELRRALELALHLAARDLAARHRFTVLGWAWPLARLLAQFSVLYFVFTEIVDVEIESFAAFLLTGLVAWNLFSTGVGNGTGAVVAQRDLVFRPRCPTSVLPVAAVATALVDALIALPVLLVVVAFDGDIGATALLLPIIAAIQVLLMVGVTWFTAAATVYLRDVREIVTVALMLLFYLTPVFYDVAKLGDDYTWALRLNPLTPLLEAYRDVLIGGRLPDASALIALAALGGAVAAGGFLFFRRLRPGFVDEL